MQNHYRFVMQHECSYNVSLVEKPFCMKLICMTSLRMGINRQFLFLSLQLHTSLHLVVNCSISTYKYAMSAHPLSFRCPRNTLLWKIGWFYSSTTVELLSFAIWIHSAQYIKYVLYLFIHLIKSKRICHGANIYTWLKTMAEILILIDMYLK